MRRVEVRGASPGIHLGNVFDDGPPPSGKRSCINGTLLAFVFRSEVSCESRYAQWDLPALLAGWPSARHRQRPARAEETTEAAAYAGHPARRGARDTCA